MKISENKRQTKERIYNLRFNPDAVALREKLKSMSYGERCYMREKIAEGCMVNLTTVSNWRLGLTKISNLHKCKIEEILGEKIFPNKTDH